jgi:hypothetical protein
VIKRVGGNLTVRLYPQLEHTVDQDEIDFVRSMMQALG